MTVAYLCLGSNKGDRVGYVQQAAGLLGATDGINIIRTSSLYETQPWMEKHTNWFVNAVVEVKTTLNPTELLEQCSRIENQLGRNREEEGPMGDRTIDIDVLFYGNSILTLPDLTVPHEHLHKRAFVLVPFLELNSDFVHPVLNKTIEQMYDELEDPEMVYLYGTRVNEE